MIGWDRDGVVTMVIGGEALSFNISDTDDYFIGWHRHCFTWKPNDTIWVKSYINLHLAFLHMNKYKLTH